MPTVYNGIGTWYYGKRRIHRRKGVCEFCKRIGELESYDTTLYFVVFFVPLLPLGGKRILEQCPNCQKHRVMSLTQWETLKAEDMARLLDKLKENPDDRDTILAALGLAVSYQDEALFEKLAISLAGHRREDAVIQAQLGAAYSYFARWPEAEAAYRASQAAEDTPEIREQLALTLLKQHRPEEATPYLQHILDQRLRDKAGQIYFLIEGYQAEGMHREALELMNRRDEAFPEMVYVKDYKAQRKTSERYQNSGKRIKSAYLSESKRAGYQEGNWTASVPRIIGPLIVLGLLAWYLGAAVWKGQNRTVYLVNGWIQPYKVAINGQEKSLVPGAPTAIQIAEGEVTVEPRDPKLPLEPVACRVETPFFSRPFTHPTFVINPDRLAILMQEETVYSQNPNALAGPPEYHLGQPLYAFRRLDYEFTEFPRTLQTTEGHTITKTRVALVPNVGAEARLRFVEHNLDVEPQKEYARRWLQFDPHDITMLYWLIGHLKEEEAIAFLKPRLSDRPVKVDWHRGYQHLMDKAHPDVDLRPEYQKLVAEMKDSPDALYLLARVQDHDEADKLLRQAAQANPPSYYAFHALGFRALSAGQFDEAVRRLEQADKLAPNNPQIRRDYSAALMAAERYDTLLDQLQARQQGPADQLSFLVERMRVYAKKGDKAKAQATLEEALEQLHDPESQPLQGMLRRLMEITLACVQNDSAGFLKLAGETPAIPPFNPALLQGKLDEAAGMVDREHDEQAMIDYGLLFLAAQKAGKQKLADDTWQHLLETLAKSGRYARQLGDMLASRQPLKAEAVRRLPIDPRQKRVLLAVVAQRHPGQAKELLPLAKKLDFYSDVTSLCLHKLWQ